MNQTLVQDNEALEDELQTARDAHDELVQQVDELEKTIKDEREKSISVVQEQLQKEHELTRQIDAANQELSERDDRLTLLQMEVEKAQTSEQTLKNQLHKLEQDLFEQQAAGKEKELLQKVMEDKEKCIAELQQDSARLVEDLRMLNEEKKEIQQLNSESTEGLTSLKQELWQMTKRRDELEEGYARLQQDKEEIQNDNKKLQETIDEMKAGLNAFKEDSRNKEAQQQTEVNISILLSLIFVLLLYCLLITIFIIMAER